ncbi:Mov34/MPN/PAD-1 family protein [Stenotrophomonas rhizophila]
MAFHRRRFRTNRRARGNIHWPEPSSWTMLHRVRAGMASMKKGWIWHWSDLGIDLLVSPAVASVFDQNRQRLPQRERGGLLFVDPCHPHGLMLCYASPPHSDDRHGIFSLTINAERARRDIEVANKNGHRLVGYWHTHPQSIPELSCTDISSFRELAQLNSETLPMPLAVIVGYSRRTDGIRAWSIRPTGISRAETLLLQGDLSHHLKGPSR